jgi:hypothetical protein
MADGGQATTSDNVYLGPATAFLVGTWGESEETSRRIGDWVVDEAFRAAVDEARRQRTTEIVAALRREANDDDMYGECGQALSLAADIIERGDIAP